MKSLRMIENRTRSYGIDLARSIAIVGVVLIHSGSFANGRFGVQLFFLVSGYLLADLGNLSSRDFLIRRAFRLFPLYWIILIIFYRGDFHSIWQLMASLSLIQGIHWVFYSIPGAWSISNEWLFSLLLPFFRRAKKNQLIGLIALSWSSQFLASFFVHRWGGLLTTDSVEMAALKVWVNTFNPAINLAFLLIGVGLKRGYIPILKNKLIGLLIIILGQALGYFVGHDLLFMWPPILWAIFSICLDWSPRYQILKFAINFIGQRTYGIFFIHFIILEYVKSNGVIKNVPEEFGLQNILIFLLTLGISALLSEVSWRFIENPSIKFSKRFISR